MCAVLISLVWRRLRRVLKQANLRLNEMFPPTLLWNRCLTLKENHVSLILFCRVSLTFSLNLPSSFHTTCSTHHENVLELREVIAEECDLAFFDENLCQKIVFLFYFASVEYGSASWHSPIAVAFFCTSLVAVAHSFKPKFSFDMKHKKFTE